MKQSNINRNILQHLNNEFTNKCDINPDFLINIHTLQKATNLIES